MAKDLFSTQSKEYSKYRPTYPQELFDYILQFVEQKKRAWDCATGNGQAANVLADYFETVDATDISEAQLDNAMKKPNIHYQISSAEKTPFKENSFDLITVATAYHWFNWKNFREEATRVGKPNSIIAIWAYNIFSTNVEAINKIIHHFYYDIVYPFWDPERRHVEDEYAKVEFNFDPLPSKNFQLHFTWNRQQFLGYLQTWSAVQNYIKAKSSSPIDLIEADVHQQWKDDETKEIYFPLFLKMGRILK